MGGRLGEEGEGPQERRSSLCASAAAVSVSFKTSFVVVFTLVLPTSLQFLLKAQRDLGDLKEFDFPSLRSPLEIPTIPFEILTIPSEILTIPSEILAIPFEILAIPSEILTIPFEILTIAFESPETLMGSQGILFPIT